MDKKKTNSKPQTKKASKPKIDYKKKLAETEKKLKHLQINFVELKRENKNNIDDFQDKAKTFSKKAQTEVNKIKKELSKKTEDERNEIKKYGSQKLVESIIDPLINIELAVKAGKNDDNVKAYVMGFEMLMNQLHNELKEHGITKIEPKISDEFNPKIHYAISKIKGNKNKVQEIKKPGYKLHDRVIKPATVIIGE